MNRPYERIRDALQELLDTDPDSGWHVAHFVVTLGLSRVDPDGSMRSTAMVAAPIDQPDYVTDGLLAAADYMRHSDDDD